MPAPCLAELEEMAELETVRVPEEALKIPPPTLSTVYTVLPEIVELVMVRVPELKKAPP